MKLKKIDYSQVESLIQRPKDNPYHRLCMLMVTHSCNLNCTYCYESFKSERHMEPNLAKNIIMKELTFVRNSEKFRDLEINFMGGEPFMNFQLIKEIVEWLSQLKQDVPFITSCTTNGTLIDDSNKDWLRTHKNIFRLVLSYDGDLEMQQRNRGTAKNPIDLQFFLETWPEESFHMTISKDTLPNLARGVLDLQRAGGTLDAALAQGVSWTDEDAIIFREQLDILKEAYLQDRTLKPINLIAGGLFGIAGNKLSQRKYCGTGTNMITYDIDGKTYPCHMFSPIVLGSERALEQENSGITEDCLITDHFCEDCNLIRWCPTCYGFNYNFRNDISSRDHLCCDMFRTQALVSSEFQIAYYSKHIDQLTGEDMPQLKAALKSYQVFTDAVDKTNFSQNSLLASQSDT